MVTWPFTVVMAMNGSLGTDKLRGLIFKTLRELFGASKWNTAWSFSGMGLSPVIKRPPLVDIFWAAHVSILVAISIIVLIVNFVGVVFVIDDIHVEYNNYDYVIVLVLQSMHSMFFRLILLNILIVYIIDIPPLIAPTTISRVEFI